MIVRPADYTTRVDKQPLLPDPHHQPLRHWLKKGVRYQWRRVPPGSSCLFQEFFEMQADSGLEPIEFPVHPLGNLLISINFQKSGTGAYLFGLNPATWPGTLAGEESVFGGAFAVGDVYSLLGIPAAELSGAIIDMEDIWPQRTRYLIEGMEQCSSIEERSNLLENFFRNNRQHPSAGHPLVRAVLADLHCSPATSIHEIARHHRVSRRHLTRLFSQHVGLSPKTMGRLYRLKHIKSLLQQDRHTNLDHLSHRLGYYDQAHFIKDFRNYFGASPARYLENGMDLS